MHRQLFIISAPSGAGKTSVVRKLLSIVPSLHLAVSHTTRPIRPGEENHKDYHFVSKELFLDMIHQNQFLEYAEVYGNMYGTSHESIKKQLTNHSKIILEIDWQGAQHIKKHFKEAISIYILPPSIAELKRRLTSRKQDNLSTINKRQQELLCDLSHAHEFDYIVTNDEFERTVQKTSEIILNTQDNYQKDTEKLNELLAELQQKQ